MKIKLTFIAIVAILALGQLAEAGSVVCRLSGIGGFSTPAAEATKAIGKETTREVTKMKVYLTVFDGDLYLHSNYVTPGASFPTKIATDEVGFDLINLLYNIVFMGEVPEAQVQQFLTDIRGASLIVDREAFKDSKFTSVMNEALLW